MCMSLSEFGRANAGASTSAATSNSIDGFVAMRATRAIPYETFHVLVAAAEKNGPRRSLIPR